MKAPFLASCLLLTAATNARAYPFVVRPVSGGFSHSDRWQEAPSEALSADFAGNGQHQWYLGGEIIRSFPGTLTRSLPAISLPSNPSAVARPLGHTLLDADRDGDLDIVRALDWNHNKTLSLVVYLNQGGGNYTVGSRRDWTENPGYDSGKFFVQLAAGDFDRDGAPDVVMLTRYFYYDISQTHYPARGYASIWYNDGIGNFGSAPLIGGRGYSRDSTLVAEDIDRDGDTASGVTNTGLFATGDVDDDGIPDLITSPAFSPSLILRKGAGNGSWSGPTTLYSFPAPIAAIVTADAEPDGDTDILVQIDNGNFYLVENTVAHRTPQFTSTSLGYEMPLAGVTQIEAADLNRDGLDDLVAVTPSQDKIWVFYGESDGLPGAPIFKLTQNEAASRVMLADFTRDGLTDLAYTIPATGDVRLVRNNGGASVTLWPDASIGTLPGASLIATGEFGTRNGQPDLVVSSATTGTIRGYYPSGNTWNYQTAWGSQNPAPACLTLENTLNSRPGDEIFFSTANSTTVRVLGLQLNPTWVGAGDFIGSLTAPPASPVMIWADVEPGGRREAVFVNGSGRLAWWAPATGSTTTTVIGTPEGTVRDIEAADWNRDGRIDLLCATSTGLDIFYKPAHTWLKRSFYNRAAGFDSVAAMNLARDGQLDIAVSSTGDGKVLFLKSRPALAELQKPPNSVVIRQGTSDIAFTASLKSAGRDPQVFGDASPDTRIKATGINLRFYRALEVNGAIQPGAALTESEFNQVVSSASLLVNGSVVGSSGQGLFSNGNLGVNYHSVFGTIVPIEPAATAGLSVRLTLTSAGNAIVQPALSGTIRFSLSRPPA